MSVHLEALIEKTRGIKMTERERERQRNSFAFGNASFENQRITRDMVEKQAQVLRTTRERDDGDSAA